MGLCEKLTACRCTKIQKDSNIIIVHCVIHRQSLVSKALPINLHSVTSLVIQVVNSIKYQPLDDISDLVDFFSKLYKAMDS